MRESTDEHDSRGDEDMDHADLFMQAAGMTAMSLEEALNLTGGLAKPEEEES